MNGFLQTIRGWTERLLASGSEGDTRSFTGRQRVILLVVGLLVAGLGAAFGGQLLAGQAEWALMLLGSASGTAWFIAGYVIWVELLPERWARAVAVRERFSIGSRRRVGAAGFVAWMILVGTMTTVTGLSGSPFVGALVVIGFLVTVLVCSFGPNEGDAAAAELETFYQDELEKADAKAEAEAAYSKGHTRKESGQRLARKLLTKIFQ